MWADWYKGGGVPCEPVMIFLLCNSFPHNAFHMHDGIHGTHFQDSDKRWQDEIKAHAINKQPDDKNTSLRGDYFKIGYLNALRSWIPDAPIQGGDSWALMWIRGWWDETDPADREVIYKGYLHLATAKGWKTDAEGAMHHTGEPSSFDFITTSFFPMIERQFWQPESGVDQRSDGVMKFVEQFGELIDTDGDGVKDSYRYAKTNDGYRDAATANLFAGMVFPNDGSSQNVIRDLFQANPPFYQQHQNEPRIAHADYPSVMVPVARYDSLERVLNFQLVAGDKAPQTSTEVEIINCEGEKTLTLNGEPFTDFTEKDGRVMLNAPAPTNTAQVWQLTCGVKPVQV